MRQQVVWQLASHTLTSGMAASSLRRLCLLQYLMSCERRYISKCSAPWLSLRPPRPVTPTHQTAVSNRRGFCQEQYNEPENGYAYSKTHEWASTKDSKLTTIGISNYAQEKLGDIVFVELPKVGDEVAKENHLGVLESVKAAADLCSPIGGTVAEINTSLEASPDLINKDPYKLGWLVKLKDVHKDDFKDLMNSEVYRKYIEE